MGYSIISLKEYATRTRDECRKGKTMNLTVSILWLLSPIILGGCIGAIFEKS